MPISHQKADFRAKLNDVPHKPGVYLMRDRLNQVIYVGKARDLRKRVSNYFMPSRKMTADVKTRALIDSIWDFEWHLAPSEAEALLLEGRLIKEFRPRYNIALRDNKGFLMVRVDMREDWPRFRLTRLKTDEGSLYFGPFAHSGPLRQTLNLLRKKFGVLTFGRGNPTERELKSSTYQVPQKLSDLSLEQYRQRVEQACDLLSGKSKEMLVELEAQMQKAAAALDFEKAAQLRDMLEDLRTTTKPMHRYTRAFGHRVGSNIDPLADITELAEALQLGAPPRRLECFDISNISNTHIVASMVCFIDGRPANHLYRRFRIKGVKGQDDFASMAEVIRRRYSRVLKEAASISARVPQTASEDTEIDYCDDYSQEKLRDAVARVAEEPGTLPVPRLPSLVIVDGGKGQLSAACRELQLLRLHELPIIGLAKEFEEIYRPGFSLPMLLPPDSGALRLLQRIRDEAHRFANGYHQILMKRRIGESLLDACPGVSESRKLLLLKRFGSVTRLKKATAEQIAELDGISAKLAEQIVRYLAEHR